MAINFMTYNFTIDENDTEKCPEMIYSTLKDTRNNITTTKFVPGMQCYLNYMSLLVSLRSKWISTGYLDLGMIPIIVGPSFMQVSLVKYLLPRLQYHELKVYPMPYSSFLSYKLVGGETEYWAFRDDVAAFLECEPSKVTIKGVITKLTGRKFK